MGFKDRTSWMSEVVNSFDTIVTSVGNPPRLQEECEVLSLKIAKITTAPTNLAEYKSCMLAALRALLPKVWEPSYEVAWSWLWENVERVLLRTLGQPPAWEKRLLKLMDSMEDNQKEELRKATYARFFELAPAGQEFFKQSNTRLHFISARVMEMTMEIYNDPVNMVEDISALGLRHVGYAIPTDLVGPFVTACIEILGSVTEDAVALEAYRWSLSVIARILVRTIQEGSTIVMKAINENSTKQLRKAVAIAPRGERAQWMLLIQVGSQKISPLYWAIQSGALEAADAIIRDLLTFRADRSKYYYAVDELFDRHPDIVKTLCQQAPSLLITLFEGLIWRSRQTKNGIRRVNYYVQHLIVSAQGGVSEAIRALAESGDVKKISHPVITLVSDKLWTGVVRQQFVSSRVLLLFKLFTFVICQAILPRPQNGGSISLDVRYGIMVGRGFLYLLGFIRILQNIMMTYKCFASNNYFVLGIFPVPGYLKDKTNFLNFLYVVFLLGMLLYEPMITCLGHNDYPTEMCTPALESELLYSVLSMFAITVLWINLIEVSVFNTKLSAFVLVCGYVLDEFGRFMIALVFLVLTFGSAISVLKTDHSEYRDIPSSVISLFAVTVGLYEKDYRELSDEPVLLSAVFLFITAAAILLLNLLIAQLNCTYEFIHQDMVGFARMNRAKLIVEQLSSTPENKWIRFVKTLRLDVPLEFDEGDVGLSGGIQVREPASKNPVLVDMIQRYGGSTDPTVPWPEEERACGDEDRFERLESLVHATLKKLVTDATGQTAQELGLGGDDY